MSTTTIPKTTNTIYGLLLKLDRGGGSIVSARSCTAEQLATARQFGHVWSDGEGMTFVYLACAPARQSVGFGSTRDDSGRMAGRVGS